MIRMTCAIRRTGPHVKEAIETLFAAHASGEGNQKGIKTGVFNRFYGEILFKHFDADNSGTLQADEAQVCAHA